jgi:hypothetical protein
MPLLVRAPFLPIQSASELAWGGGRGLADTGPAPGPSCCRTAEHGNGHPCPWRASRRSKVDVPHPDLAQLLQPRTGVQEEVQDGRVAPFLEAAAFAVLEQPAEGVVVGDGDGLLGDRGGLRRRMGWDLLLVLEPGVEAVQDTEAVVGRRRPSAFDDVDEAILDVGGGGLGRTPDALVQERGELFECLEVGVDGALGLALSPQ